MPQEETAELQLQCYNLSCGQKYTEETNTNDACCYHSGAPFFHDAYKGWSCCNKKSIDFTEFLNIKGCTRGRHSNVKPPEVIPATNSSSPITIPEETNQVPEVMVAVKLDRPPFDTPMIQLVAIIGSPALKEQRFNNAQQDSHKDGALNDSETPIGTACKHSGCTATYGGGGGTVCVYHAGVPIFHEGMKFWSCCKKRTTDFTTFLNQVGCTQAEHQWVKSPEGDSSTEMNCRWDFHQTGGFAVVTIYAKQYCIETSMIEVNPIRLHVKLVFPNQSNALFTLDKELFGIIDLNSSQATMYTTKVEVKLKKAEVIHWTQLMKEKKETTTK